MKLNYSSTFNLQENGRSQTYGMTNVWHDSYVYFDNYNYYIYKNIPIILFSVHATSGARLYKKYKPEKMCNFSALVVAKGGMYRLMSGDWFGAYQVLHHVEGVSVGM